MTDFLPVFGDVVTIIACLFIIWTLITGLYAFEVGCQEERQKHIREIDALISRERAKHPYD